MDTAQQSKTGLAPYAEAISEIEKHAQAIEEAVAADAEAGKEDAEAITAKATAEQEQARALLLVALTERENLARALAEDKTVTMSTLSTIAELDRSLKRLVKVTPSDARDAPPVAKVKIAVPKVNDEAEKEAASITMTLADWQVLLQPPPNAWWRAPESGLAAELDWRQRLKDLRRSWLRRSLKSAPALLCWLLIAASLSYLIELARRYLSAGVDILSVVVQGIVALIAGGVLQQIAARLIPKPGDASSLTPPQQNLFERRISLGLLTAFCLITVVLAHTVALPWLVRHYNNRAVREEGLSEKIKLYELALSLAPDAAALRYNLASVHDQLRDYDKAITEYQRTISIDDRCPEALANLARLQILRHKDYGRALDLLSRINFDDIKNPPKVPRPWWQWWPSYTGPGSCRQEQPTELHQNHTAYSIHKNRGWALLKLGEFEAAKVALEKANSLNLEEGLLRPSAYCLLAQLYEQQGSSEAADEWGNCAQFGCLVEQLGPNQQEQDKNDAEAEWVIQAVGKLPSDKKECIKHAYLGGTNGH